MKHTLLLLLAFPLLATNCENDPDLSPLDQLPPATQTGEYTFGCLVNGEAFVPRTSTDISAIFQGGFLQIGANVEDRVRDQNLKLVVDGPIIYENMVYNLVNPTLNYTTFNEVLDSSICWYEPENTLSGTLTITHFDNENYIVSGTFEFVTATEGCDTIRVTDGRFDTHYIP